MDYKNLLIEKKNHIAIVTLNRPDKGNALSIDLMEEIQTAAEAFKKDVETRVIIFTGKGKYFSTGADLSDPRQFALSNDSILMKQRQYSIGPRMIRSLTEIDQITIAAVNGISLGGATCIASALDFRIGAQSCKMAYPEVNLGIPLSWTSLPLCAHLVGPARAKRFVILGKREHAKTLLEWGFLDEVVPDDKIMERAMEMAQEYARQAPIPAQMIKRSINAISSYMDQAIMHMDSDQIFLARSSKDFEEGIAAVFEKRKPDFKGA